MKESSKDIIQKIPAGLEKYLGVGDMVLPSADTIRKELRKVSSKSLITIPLLREKIATQFEVTTACPKSTLKVIRQLMKEELPQSFHVINGKGELVGSDLAAQSNVLLAEGFELDTSKTKPKVKDFKSFLMD